MGDDNLSTKYFATWWLISFVGSCSFAYASATPRWWAWGLGWSIVSLSAHRLVAHIAK